MHFVIWIIECKILSNVSSSMQIGRKKIMEVYFKALMEIQDKNDYTFWLHIELINIDYSLYTVQKNTHINQTILKKNYLLTYWHTNIDESWYFANFWYSFPLGMNRNIFQIKLSSTTFWNPDPLFCKTKTSFYINF